MANFYLVCGISGGGKTILSKRIKEYNPDIVMLDVDEYYAEINGDECIRENTFEVWHKLYQDIHNYEKAGIDVLLTSNALTVSQRNQFIEWFPAFNHHMIWVVAPWEKCVEGNKSRRRHVEYHKLQAQWERMEFPNAHEKGWDTIAHVTNTWTGDYIIFNLKGDIKEQFKPYTFEPKKYLQNWLQQSTNCYFPIINCFDKENKDEE